MIEVSRDIRGRIFELGVIDDKHVNILVTKKGGLRGGHYHGYDEEFFVVFGEVLWNTRLPEGITDSKRDFQMDPFTIGQVIKSDPGVPHMLLALTDCVVVEFRPAGTEFRAKDYEPMRALIRAQLAKASL